MSERTPDNKQPEKEPSQERIEQIINTISQKIDENFDHMKRLNAKGRLHYGSKLTDEEVEAEFRHHAEFLLPTRGKAYSLDVHLLAADPYVSPYDKESEHFGREDDVAEFVYRHIDDDEDYTTETADVFIVSSGPAGELVLEKITRDLSEANRAAEHLYKLAIGESDDSDFDAAEEQYIERDVKNRQSATAARKDGRELGLTAANDEDFDELEKLVDQATIDLS